MNSRKLPQIAFVLLMLIGPIAPATAALRLDDTGTRAHPAVPQWVWSNATLRTSPNQLTATVRVEVRINTGLAAGQRGRVFLVLAADGDAVITAAWRGSGKLLDGRVTSGGRQLVFSGQLPPAMLEDEWLLVLTADARQMVRDRRSLDFRFEFEAD